MSCDVMSCDVICLAMLYVYIKTQTTKKQKNKKNKKQKQKKQKKEDKTSFFLHIYIVTHFFILSLISWFPV